MASLTATLDNDSPRYHRTGSTLTGTFSTSSDTEPTVDQLVLLPTSTFITDFSATCEDGAGVIRGSRNVNSAGAATNGTVRIQSNDIAARTYHFKCTFQGS